MSHMSDIITELSTPSLNVNTETPITDDEYEFLTDLQSRVSGEIIGITTGLDGLGEIMGDLRDSGDVSVTV